MSDGRRPPPDPPLLRASVDYVDGIFGEGAGERHAHFLEHLRSDALRDTLHRYHLQESDTRWLSREENYLLGMAVLCAQRHYATAGMFAKTLRHLGVADEKILEAVSRLSMWIGGVPAAEAASHIQKALEDYRQKGLESLDGWFPPAARGGGTGGA
ncbi:MAG TPA: hypothetical protein VEY30_06850 [Myxococcaceae bacterium]|nr:hypothetical protein [Myxococcaceae bacterium]